MEGLALIEGKELDWLKNQLVNIQQQNLLILKQLKELMPVTSQSNVPDFISIPAAAKKYETTRQTIYNKIKLFEKENKRPIDRLRKLVNEFELQKALRIVGAVPKSFQQCKTKMDQQEQYMPQILTPKS